MRRLFTEATHQTALPLHIIIEFIYDSLFILHWRLLMCLWRVGLRVRNELEGWKFLR